MRGDRIKIVIDSNEASHGRTWTFPRDIPTTVQSLLKYGCDYALKGQVGIVGVERKSWNDYVKCLGKDLPRFKKQLAKLRRNKYCALIVEANLNTPINERSTLSLDTIMSRTATIAAMGIPVLFVHSRYNAAFICLQFFRQALQRIRNGV
jgi:ERCC4-type nuclease